MDVSNPNLPTYIFCVENMSYAQVEDIKKRLESAFPYANIIVTNAQKVYRFPPEGK